MLPYLINGVSVGGQYALIAIGYTLVYGILRLINFAHGDVFMVAGLLMVYLTASMPMYVSLPLVLLLTVILGFCIERAAYKPLRTAPRMSVMISSHKPMMKAPTTAPGMEPIPPNTAATKAFSPGIPPEVMDTDG